MKSGNGIIRLGWACFWLILLAAGLYALGKQNQDVLPDPDSYKPGGAAAFAQLLEENGYQVQVTDAIPSHVEPGTVILAFVPLGLLSDDESASGSGPLGSALISEGVIETTKLIEKHLDEGGNAVLLSYQPDTLADVRGAGTMQGHDDFGRTYNLSVPGTPTAITGAFANDPSQPSYPGWRVGSSETTLLRSKHGTTALVPVGQAALNRFIDLGDNARFFMDVVSTVAPKGSTILIETASIRGAATPSVLQLIGPWAQGAWWQLLFLGVVAVFTLGKRFGLAETTPLKQQASRELLDGVSDTFARSRAAKAALIRVTQDVDARLRKELKLPAEGAREKRNERLPDQLRRTLLACENAIQGPVKPNEATRLAHQLETEMVSFLGITSRMNRGRRRVK